MERKKKHVTYLLLIFYTVVLVHNSIAHRYDCEILNTVFSCNEEYTYDLSSKIGIHEHDHHFNIFSDDINLNLKKQIVNTDFISPTNLVINPSHRTCEKREDFFDHYHYIQPYSIFFSLRSPPLA